MRKRISEKFLSLRAALYYSTKTPPNFSVVLNGEHAKTKFALRASEAICDSEVHFVSEVSPDGEAWANLTSLVRSTNFTV